MWRSRYTSPGRETVSQPIHYKRCDYSVLQQRFLSSSSSLLITSNPNSSSEKMTMIYPEDDDSYFPNSRAPPVYVISFGKRSAGPRVFPSLSIFEPSV
ncbi:hypothetical protein F2Q70_00016298 [Brassica cretica]|uniref:Uncharacterized protein n=1 Tax=Brassica cretica TaxID=69181 RepID=A0A8S9I0Q8_BRACR|nr:hypothetical protein F2Q70_00016298 [Brassica cretica]